MDKLIRGILEFRRTRRDRMAPLFAALAGGQAPDTLFVACSDSRVVPNLFASTDPGDLFVLRNVGNLVPPCAGEGCACTDRAAAAALEFAVLELAVRDIVVCGHSDCGAMKALLAGPEHAPGRHIAPWLQHAAAALERTPPDPVLPPADRLAQANVLLQLDHLRTYAEVREAEASGRVRLHGWFFDLARADVHAFDPGTGRFRLIDDGTLERLD